MRSGREIGEEREALIAVTIPERPGSLRKFCERLGDRNITEFNYRHAASDDAHIFVGVELKGRSGDRKDLVRALEEGGFPVVDMSDNEMAKLHTRYMVGGRAKGVEQEVLYRFFFPDRPGALLRFLDHMGAHWNISLFHYRNHGSDYGRVLMGIQVPRGEHAEFQDFLERVGYDYVDETRNPAYRMFLA